MRALTLNAAIRHPPGIMHQLECASVLNAPAKALKAEIVSIESHFASHFLVGEQVVSLSLDDVQDTICDTPVLRSI
jgi:hypothetical protein